MDYKETLDFLFNSLPVFQHIGVAAYKAGMENSEALDEYFGHPHRKFMTVHVAGTNGKGSTSHMIAAALQEAGYKTGLYTSPHLYDFRERIRVNGEMISESEVVDFVEKHKAVIGRIEPSFFEMTVFMALDYFDRSNVDIAVIEVGMGGRLDSTNVITPLISVITNISLDHTQFLGTTVREIAAEKAGIIKPGVPVVIGESDPETALTFISKARECGSRIYFADKLYECVGSEPAGTGQTLKVRSLANSLEFDISMDLAGSYQKKNILTVITALEVLNDTGKVSISRKQLTRGIAHTAAATGLAGRWQALSQAPLTIADTAHNKAGLSETMAQLKSLEYDNLYIVIGFANDKDLDGVLPLLPKNAYYFFTQASIKRALDAKILALKATGCGLNGEVVTDVQSALDHARERASANDVIYVGGSNFIIAEIKLKV